MRDIGKQIAHGVFWNLLRVSIVRFGNLFFMLFLARLLAPEAFGLIAMVMVWVSLGNILTTSGLGTALVRAKHISASDLDTVFWANLGMSLFVYTILFVCAPQISKLYDNPNLALVIRVSTLVVLITGLTVVQTAVLSREMNFKSIMAANTIAVVLSGTIALIWASYRPDEWSLVTQLLLSSGVTTGILWYKSKWRPSFSFHKEVFREHFRFARPLLADNFLSALYQNSYILVIGYYFGPALTGHYFLARKMVQVTSNNVSTAFQQASLPALATLQDNTEKLRAKYREIIQLALLIISLFMAFMATISQPMISLFFGDKWAGAVPYLQLLSVFGVIAPLHALNTNILQVKGRSGLLFRIGLFKKIVGVTFLACTIPYGVKGIIVGQIASSIINLIPNFIYSERLIGYGFRMQFIDTLKPVVAALVAASAITYFLQNVHFVSYMMLILAVIVGALAFLLTSLALRAEGVSIMWRKRSVVFGMFGN